MSSQLPILTVSQLNRQVKGFLENEIGLVHVEGEISNLSKPSSGHYYFTLKDSTAQIRCAFFKNRHSNSLLRNFNDGQQIVATGKLSLYEARGEYQLIVEEIVEAGMGILYQRFEELKIKLASEGLFNPERKKTLPRIPETIGIITSPTGAAIQDILSTLA
ncbi:exodeoxyribonuclease VII large subunit, partial [Legionella pneumophila]